MLGFERTNSFNKHSHIVFYALLNISSRSRCLVVHLRACYIIGTQLFIINKLISGYTHKFKIIKKS